MQDAPPAPQLDKALNEQVLMLSVGSGFFSYTLAIKLFRLPGEGPFPLLLMMRHGKAPNMDNHFQRRVRYLGIAREFVERGYAIIIPMRKCFSQSSGSI